ncbi:MAG: hypothetical protein ACK4GJ_06975, partial [bacterium]
MSDYIIKLKALLHDPLDKQYVMWELKKRHKEVAKKFIEKLIYESLEDENVKIADHLASAISRIVVAPKFKNEELRKKFEEETIPDPAKNE